MYWLPELFVGFGKYAPCVVVLLTFLGSSLDAIKCGTSRYYSRNRMGLVRRCRVWQQYSAKFESFHRFYLFFSVTRILGEMSFHICLFRWFSGA